MSVMWDRSQVDLFFYYSIKNEVIFKVPIPLDPRDFCYVFPVHSHYWFTAWVYHHSEKNQDSRIFVITFRRYQNPLTFDVPYHSMQKNPADRLLHCPLFHG
jgi:competence transcription factor ComK